jgi:hypothetical protein
VIGPLDLRADSLIARLLDDPGQFSSDGHVYVYLGNYALLDWLGDLEMHAVPQLIDCVGDVRQSRATYLDPRTAESKPALRGTLCFQALIGTHFWRMQDGESMHRIRVAVGCEGDERTKGRRDRQLATTL